MRLFNRPARAILALVILLPIIMTSCQANSSISTTQAGTTAGSASQAAATTATAYAKPTKLTYWVALPSTNIKSLDENLTWSTMQKLFNVDIEFIHPTIGQEKEQFSLMIAGRELADLIEYTWTSYDGGPEKACSDGIILELGDLIGHYAPSLSAYMAEKPEIARQFTSDDGSILVFPSLNKSIYNTTSGFFLRSDWLKDFNMATPDTIAEIETYLKACKDQKQATAPFSLQSSSLLSESMSGIWGVGAGLYIDGKTVKYGPNEAGFKNFVQMMTNWYATGLLDPDFVAVNANAINSNMLAGKTGLSLGANAGNMGTILDSAAAKKISISLTGIQFPVLKEGDQVRFTPRAWEYRGTSSTALTTINKYPEFSAALMDYFYSDKGHILKNFGIEGQSFTMVNGKAKYGDLIMKNPDGLSYREAMRKYLRCDAPFPGFIDTIFHETTFVNKEQTEAALLWSKNDANSVKTKMPTVSLTTAESSEVASIQTTISTFVSEKFVAFIMGQESLDRYDAFVSEINNMGIKRMLEIYQTAYDRYIKR